MVKGGEKMDYIHVLTLLTEAGNIGFPTVLVIYLLFRFERKIEGLTEAIEKLGTFPKKG
jgi:hypothetical protein